VLLDKSIVFEFRRDPRDEKFLELAISLKATHILSSDKDLLSLPRERSEAGRRFRQRLPALCVSEAGEFIQGHGTDLRIV
jgi:predicted nucleic acid-binding protein